MNLQTNQYHKNTNKVELSNLVHYDFTKKQIIELKEPKEFKEPKKENKQDPKYTNQEGRIPVQPIKDQKVIQQVSDYLLKRPCRYKSQNLRDYTLWCLNINIGLRAGDLIHLKISNILKNNEIVDMMSIYEEKTRNKIDKLTGEIKKTNKPPRIITFDTQIKNLLMNYINSFEDWNADMYLFHPRGNPYKAMTVRNLNYIMTDIKQEMDLKFPFASHSMRKIFARERYLYFERIGHPMPLQALSEAMNHSSLKMTRMYIGLSLEDTAKVYTEPPILGLL